jgi:voltage-gated potassium channel Kch
MSNLNDMNVEAEAETEFRRGRLQFKLIALGAFLALLIGAVFFHYTEGMKWLDAFYFCTITLTTVGYGDIVPHTDAGKLFDIFYILTGIGIIATFANVLIKQGTLRRNYRASGGNPRHPSKPTPTDE